VAERRTTRRPARVTTVTHRAVPEEDALHRHCARGAGSHAGSRTLTVQREREEAGDREDQDRSATDDSGDDAPRPPTFPRPHRNRFPWMGGSETIGTEILGRRRGGARGSAGRPRRCVGWPVGPGVEGVGQPPAAEERVLAVGPEGAWAPAGTWPPRAPTDPVRVHRHHQPSRVRAAHPVRRGRTRGFPGEVVIPRAQRRRTCRGMARREREKAGINRMAGGRANHSGRRLVRCNTGDPRNVPRAGSRGRTSREGERARTPRGIRRWAMIGGR
jgi:hypothetical protein